MSKLLLVKLTPNAKHSKIEDGLFYDENGNEYIKVYTTVIAEDGKANKDLIKILAKEYKISKSSIKLVNGFKNKFKTLEISD